jgi:predicted DNA-binding WGR domain protein
MPQLPDELRHAYRALLRAATYLPDPAARAYIHNYAVFRFRDVANKIQKKDGEAAEKLVARYHSGERIGKVWQASRQLERAGEGNAADLQKVLYRTYGRAGKRRRELVQQLLDPDEYEFPTDQTALEELIQKQSEKEERRHKDNLQLKALINSQKFHQPLDTRAAKLKTLSPQIPKTNVWERPVPLKLQASIGRRYWADALEKLLPPVPRYEWDRLRDLATGATRIEDPPSRRSRPPREPCDTEILEYFTTPANRQGSEVKGIQVGEHYIAASLEKSTHTRGLKTMTPRFMRRLYATIWSMTPTMSQDETTKIWTTKWGGSRSAALTGQVTTPSTMDMELFEGADDHVKPPKTQSLKEKREKNVMKRYLPEHRPERKVLLGDEGYSQGLVPAI